MTAETISTKPLNESLLRSIGRTITPGRRPSNKWSDEVYTVRQRLLGVGVTDNRYVHALLYPHGVSTATSDITGEVTGSNHRGLMTRYGGVKRLIKQAAEPLPHSVRATAKLINEHTPDATNSDRYALLGHLLGQAGVEVTTLPPDTNPADQFNCRGDQALIVSGKTLFVGIARNTPRIEAQDWVTPYASLPRLT